MIKRFIFIIVWTITLVSSQVAIGQTCCTGGAPLTGSLNIRALPVNSWGVSFTYDYNAIEDLVQGTEARTNDNLYRKTQTLVTQIDYGIVGNLTATIVIPYLWLNQKVISSSINESSSGIGDILFLSQYGKSIGNRNYLVIGAGLKVPTGATQNINEDLGTPLPPTLQPGTGSLDFFFSGQYQLSFNSRPSLVFTQTMNVRINSESTDFTFHDSYRFGHVVQSFSALADQFVTGSLIQNPSIMIRYRYATKDLLEGNSNENSGGHWIYLSPGWATNISKNITLGFVGEFPLYRNLNGFQLTTSRKFIATLQFLIPTRNDIPDL